MNRHTCNLRPRGYFSEVHYPRGFSPHSYSRSERCLRGRAQPPTLPVTCSRVRTSLPHYFYDILCSVSRLDSEFQKLEDLFSSSKTQQVKFPRETRRSNQSEDDLVYLNHTANALLRLTNNLKQELVSHLRVQESRDYADVGHTDSVIMALESKLYDLLRRLEGFKRQLVKEPHFNGGFRSTPYVGFGKRPNFLECKRASPGTGPCKAARSECDFCSHRETFKRVCDCDRRPCLFPKELQAHSDNHCNRSTPESDTIFKASRTGRCNIGENCLKTVENQNQRKVNNKVSEPRKDKQVSNLYHKSDSFQRKGHKNDVKEGRMRPKLAVSFDLNGNEAISSKKVPKESFEKPFYSNERHMDGSGKRISTPSVDFERNRHASTKRNRAGKDGKSGSKFRKLLITKRKHSAKDKGNRKHEFKTRNPISKQSNIRKENESSVYSASIADEFIRSNESLDLSSGGRSSRRTRKRQWSKTNSRPKSSKKKKSFMSVNSSKAYSNRSTDGDQSQMYDDDSTKNLRVYYELRGPRRTQTKRSHSSKGVPRKKRQASQRRSKSKHTKRNPSRFRVGYSDNTPVVVKPRSRRRNSHVLVRDINSDGSDRKGRHRNKRFFRRRSSKKRRSSETIPSKRRQTSHRRSTSRRLKRFLSKFGIRYSENKPVAVKSRPRRRHSNVSARDRKSDSSGKKKYRYTNKSILRRPSSKKRRSFKIIDEWDETNRPLYSNNFNRQRLSCVSQPPRDPQTSGAVRAPSVCPICPLDNSYTRPNIPGPKTDLANLDVSQFFERVSGSYDDCCNIQPCELDPCCPPQETECIYYPLPCSTCPTMECSPQPPVCEITPPMCEITPPICEITPPICEITPPICEITPPICEEEPVCELLSEPEIIQEEIVAVKRPRKITRKHRRITPVYEEPVREKPSEPEVIKERIVIGIERPRKRRRKQKRILVEEAPSSEEESDYRSQYKYIYFKPRHGSQRKPVRFGKFVKKSRERVIEYDISKPTEEPVVISPTVGKESRRTSTTELLKIVKAIGTNTQKINTSERGIDPMPQKLKTPVIIKKSNQFTNTEKVITRNTGTDSIPQQAHPQMKNIATDPLYINRQNKQTNTAPEVIKKKDLKDTATSPVPLEQKTKFTNTKSVSRTNAETETDKIPRPTTANKGVNPERLEMKDKQTSYKKISTAERGINPAHTKTEDKGQQFDTLVPKPEVKSVFTATDHLILAGKVTQTLSEKKPSVYDSETQTDKEQEKPRKKLPPIVSRKYPPILKPPPKSIPRVPPIDIPESSSEESVLEEEPSRLFPKVEVEKSVGNVTPSEISVHLVLERCKEEVYRRYGDVSKQPCCRQTKCGTGRNDLVFEKKRSNIIRIKDRSSCKVVNHQGKDGKQSLEPRKTSLTRITSAQNQLPTKTHKYTNLHNRPLGRGLRRRKLSESCGIKGNKRTSSKTTHVSRKDTNYDSIYSDYKNKNNLESNISDESDSSIIDWKNIADRIRSEKDSMKYNYTK